MNLVFVVQEKSIKNVVELYKKIAKEIRTIDINPIIPIINFFDLNN